VKIPSFNEGTAAMDWNAAIERNREALKRILAMLVAMAGLDARGQSPAPTLPRHLHRAILALLRPAEAAARRLVIVAARDLVVELPRPRRAEPKAGSIFVRSGKGTGIVLPHGVKPGAILPGLSPPRQAPRSLALPLLDPLPGWPGHPRPPANGVPRISAPGIAEPHRGPDRRPPLPGDAIDATRLALRLQAVGRVLDDLPAHARRFARWRLRRDAAGTQKEDRVAAGAQKEDRVAAGAQKEDRVAAGAQKEDRVAAGAQNQENRAGLFRRISPLRPGRPAGGRRRPTHEVHEVLADLHHFAFYALERADSS
jgi:hypothetical protein